MKALQEEIYEILRSIEGSGTFISEGTQSFVFPGLDVRGVGELGFPINEIQAKALIHKAIQAPFGKGMETVTDTNVRKTWEIDASELTFNNPDWEKTLNQMLTTIKFDLGIENYEVSASLYKLLIYEEGGFFLPHKDSEKEKGMFGTLIINLPSKHTGGNLSVSFGGQNIEVDFSGNSLYELAFAAFYADCEHEVKAVTSGYRVCVVYNLIQKNDYISGNPQFDEQTADLAQLFDKKKSDFDQPKAILLSHQYTPENFGLSTLKSHDRPRTEALLEAAKAAGFHAKLGLVTHYLMGELEGVGYGDYGRRGRYYDDYEDEEGTMGEIYETSTEIQYWADDNYPDLGTIDINEKNVWSDEIELGEDEPISKEQEGYTGNAGMTMQYWYHYGAVILWTPTNHLELLKNRPVAVLLDWVNYYCDNWTDETEYQLKTILPSIEEKSKNDTYGYRSRNVSFNPLVRALIQLNDIDFIINNDDLLISIFQKIDEQSWANLFDAFDTSVFSMTFEKIGQKGDLDTLGHLTSILAHLAKNNQHQDFVVSGLHALPQYIDKTPIDKARIKSYYGTDDNTKEITKIIDNLLRISPLLENDEEWRKTILTTITQKINRDLVNDVLMPLVLKEEFSESLFCQELQTICRQDLQKRVDNKPLPPKNWTREVPNSKDKNWKLLEHFLKSPTEQVFDYRANQSYRSSLESTIKSVTIDLIMETIKSGSPHILRIIKTQAAYNLKLKHWKEDVDFLNRLDA